MYSPCLPIWRGSYQYLRLHTAARAAYISASYLCAQSKHMLTRVSYYAWSACVQNQSFGQDCNNHMSSNCVMSVVVLPAAVLACAAAAALVIARE